MRLHVPRFNGSDPESWIFTIGEYFALHRTTEEQRMRIVSFHLDGDVGEWFRWMKRNNMVTTWNDSLESVRNRFGPSQFEDPQGALSKLI